MNSYKSASSMMFRPFIDRNPIDTPFGPNSPTQRPRRFGSSIRIHTGSSGLWRHTTLLVSRFVIQLVHLDSPSMMAIETFSRLLHLRAMDSLSQLLGYDTCNRSLPLFLSRLRASISSSRLCSLMDGRCLASPNIKAL